MRIGVRLSAAVAVALIAGSARGAPTADAPRFTGTGTIVFACSGCPQNPTGPGLYAVSASGRGFRTLPTAGLRPFYPRWSADGRHVAFTSMFRSTEIWRIDPSRGRRRRLTRACAECDRHPAWSPDGRRIVFSRHGVLYTMNADGTRERRLTSARRGKLIAPDWSPDGRLIVFQAAVSKLGTVRSDGSRFRWLRGISGERPRWSPDGRWIAFVARAGRSFAVKIVRPDGTGVRLVVRRAEIDVGGGVAWSPGGRRLLFAVSHLFDPEEGGYGCEFLVARLDGSGVRRIVIPELPRDVHAQLHGIDWASGTPP